MREIVYSLYLAGLLGFTGLVAAESYGLDPVHTQIMFSVSHQGFSYSSGAFTRFSGGFSFDEADIEKSSVEVSIQTDSIDMNDATWNSHLRGAQWFFAAKYPEMRFRSVGVARTGEKTMDVAGELTLLGTTRPVTLHVTLNKIGDSNGTLTAGFSAHTTIDRTDFGMETFAPVIGAEVAIRIQVEGKKL